MLFWMDGKFVEDDEAMVSVYDYGYLYGDGCFESIAVAEGVIIDFDARIDRFFKSAKMMQIEIPMSRDELRELLIETAVRNNFGEARVAYLRPMLSRGSASIGMHNANRRGTLRILGADAAHWEGKSAYRDPIRVVSTILSSYTRTGMTALDPRIKPFSYSTGILANFEAMDRGADWAIHRDENGYLVEATAANLFCVTDETIFTPPLRSALAGITRRGVIDAAKALGIECLEMDLTRYDLLTSDEAFLSSAFWGVGAIRSFEGQPLADPVPGPLTSRVREAYVERVLAAGTPIPARVPAGLTVTERPL